MDIEYDLYADAHTHTHTDMYTVHQTNFFFRKRFTPSETRGGMRGCRAGRLSACIEWLSDYRNRDRLTDRDKVSKGGVGGGV